MSEAPSLLDYQREATTAKLSPVRTIEEGEPPWTRKAALLSLEGWEYEVRLGKRIWCRCRGDPWSFWKSEEMAYRIVKGGPMK